jgi:hypothetical protein
MTKIYETRLEPARETRMCVGRKCDLCGAESRGVNWERKGGRFDVRETEVQVIVRSQVGTSYPEGGAAVVWDIDLCPECFVGKLVPWLRSQGAEVEGREVDW